MSSQFLKYFLQIAFLCSCLAGFSQTKKDLEKQREELNRKIKETNILIQKTRQSTKQVKGQLQLLESQIKLREQLINTINQEIYTLEENIDVKKNNILSKEQELQKLRAEYARMLQNVQLRSNRYNQMLFVFASQDFYQAFKRLRYIQQYSNFRRDQAMAIESAQKALGLEIRSLSDKRVEKTSLLGVKETEKQRLNQDKTSQVNTISKLQSEEKGLKKELAKQESEKKKVDREIARALAAEIKKSKAENKGSFKLAPESKIVSDNFAANRGNMPWPVDKGSITGRFGRQPHPVLKNITIDNSGIDISTSAGASVKAIFKGSVSSILVIPGAGKVVVLDHGAYRSVYTNLKEVFVQKGQAIKIGQSLGNCLPDEDGTGSNAHLEIWQIGQNGTEKLNPTLWLKK